LSDDTNEPNELLLLPNSNSLPLLSLLAICCTRSMHRLISSQLRVSAAFLISSCQLGIPCTRLLLLLSRRRGDCRPDALTSVLHPFFRWSVLDTLSLVIALAAGLLEGGARNIRHENEYRLGALGPAQRLLVFTTSRCGGARFESFTQV
jgi:hypothetical protein